MWSHIYVVFSLHPNVANKLKTHRLLLENCRNESAVPLFINAVTTQDTGVDDILSKIHRFVRSKSDVLIVYRLFHAITAWNVQVNVNIASSFNYIYMDHMVHIHVYDTCMYMFAHCR